VSKDFACIWKQALLLYKKNLQSQAKNPHSANIFGGHKMLYFASDYQESGHEKIFRRFLETGGGRHKIFAHFGKNSLQLARKPHIIDRLLNERSSKYLNSEEDK